jgi:F-type H+-transporting ATPase subunit beta
MESGGWDLSKVDMPGRESKATFVFGQMNEPPGARARSTFDYLLLSISVMEQGTDQGKDVLFFVDKSSVLHKQVLRFRHFWVVCHLQ